jgi:glycosyltransferase involved in cell wall biosynthesis
LKIKSFKNINELSSYFQFSHKGQVITLDVDQTDFNIANAQRKMKDSEVLSTLAANVNGFCLEVGTSYGYSAVQIAHNINDGLLFTVNLLPSQLKSVNSLHTHLPTVDEIGHLYRDVELDNVAQIYANSVDWVVPSCIDRLQLVFIDGDHHEDMVFTDSQKLYSRIESGGYLVWHDFNPYMRQSYKWIDSSMRGAEKFLQYIRHEGQVYHLEQSWVGFIQKSQESNIPRNKKSVSQELEVPILEISFLQANEVKQAYKIKKETKKLYVGVFYDHENFISHNAANIFKKYMPEWVEPVFIDKLDNLKLINLDYIIAVDKKSLNAAKSTVPRENILINECSYGVDDQLFYPASHISSVFTKCCWIGNTEIIEDDELELISSACKKEGISLLILDYKFVKDKDLLSNNYIRDNYFHSSNLYICAPLIERTLNPILEALSCGLPVISTDVGIATEIVRDGWNGFIVERTEVSVREAIRKVKELNLKEMSFNARQTISLGWSWQSKLQNLISILD